MIAGISTLNSIKKKGNKLYQKLNDLGSETRKILDKKFDGAVITTGIGSLFLTHFLTNKIHEINNLYDYQYIHDIFKQDHYQNGMFFCMKEGIFPNWEDPDNRSGGCLSFKVTSISGILFLSFSKPIILQLYFSFNFLLPPT